MGKERFPALNDVSDIFAGSGALEESVSRESSAVVETCHAIRCADDRVAVGSVFIETRPAGIQLWVLK